MIPLYNNKNHSKGEAQFLAEHTKVQEHFGTSYISEFIGKKFRKNMNKNIVNEKYI